MQMRALMLGCMTAVALAAPPKKVAVEKRDLKMQLQLSAIVAPQLWASLSAPSGGLVKEVFVDLGALVKKGQKLATLDGHGKPMPVLAPFDGVIVARNAQPGVYSTDGVGLFTEMNDSQVRLELEVPENDAPLIKVGQPITARFEALPGQVYKATLSLIVPQIDPRSHTLHADAALDNPDHRLIAGMSGAAELDVAMHAGALAIPFAAVTRDGNRTSVFRVEGDRARKVAVTLGIVEGELVEIVNGLNAGDLVVVGAVKEGDAIPR